MSSKMDNNVVSTNINVEYFFLSNCECSWCCPIEGSIYKSWWLNRFVRPLMQLAPCAHIHAPLSIFLFVHFLFVRRQKKSDWKLHVISVQRTVDLWLPILTLARGYPLLLDCFSVKKYSKVDNFIVM